MPNYNDETVIVALGNPFDGLTFHGPFDSWYDAETWIGNTDDEWHVVKLEVPESTDRPETT